MVMSLSEYDNTMKNGHFLLFEENDRIPAGVYVIHAQADTDVWDIQNTETLESYFVTDNEVRKYASKF